MATVKEALDILRDFAPEEYKYKAEYDNIGLQVGNYNDEVTKIICCLDCTMPVIEEAISVGANLIITHHPIIWNPIYNVTSDNSQGQKLLAAIKNGISIYAAHSNLDFVSDGINEYVADALSLRNLKPLIPYINENAGFGRVGDLSNKVYASVLKGEVETILKDSHVRIIGEPLTQVKRVAVINGGGGGDLSYIDLALKENANCLITADVKHHFAIYARENNLTIIEPQHFNMEYVYIVRLVQILKIEAKSKKINIEILQSVRENNPRF